ncbi:acetyltransferase (GNAT) family protein [Sphaerotilus hippei]|uniref:Acetyltransferase (GNAT) family protein n=1 Tax=Sphaerotilus hippei TaxID=744406 RepID=A0A318GZ30_9BURK|nr:acetyltransferase (GNAT) family protein [Sphaerotilus hippei]
MTEADLVSVDRQAQLRVRVVSQQQFGEAERQAWLALEARALEPHPGLSPHFLLPALQHLEASRRGLFLMIERQTGHGRELVGLALCHGRTASAVMPAPHLALDLPRHAAQGGLLVDGRWLPEVAVQLLSSLPRNKGLVLEGLVDGGGLQQALVAAAGALGRHVEQRPPVPQGTCRVPWATLPFARTVPARSEPAQRCHQALARLGRLDWRLHQGPIPAAVVDAFLRLEHEGPHRLAGTSLLSSPADEAFFRDVVARFSTEARVVFAELTLDGDPVASLCLFGSAGRLHAFRAGSRRDLTARGAELLNEVELARRLPMLPGDWQLAEPASGQPVPATVSLVLPVGPWQQAAAWASRRVREVIERVGADRPADFTPVAGERAPAADPPARRG